MAQYQRGQQAAAALQRFALLETEADPLRYHALDLIHAIAAMSRVLAREIEEPSDDWEHDIEYRCGLSAALNILTAQLRASYRELELAQREAIATAVASNADSLQVKDTTVCYISRFRPRRAKVA